VGYADFGFLRRKSSKMGDYSAEPTKKDIQLQRNYTKEKGGKNRNALYRMVL